MGYIRIKKLPAVESVIQRFPLSAKAHERIMLHRKEVKQILAGRDERLLMIIGPCSAWPKEAVFEYATGLFELSQRLNKHLKIVMRMYIQKPRTTKGWAGPLSQPDPFGEPDIEAGIYYVREMMVKVVELGLPIADECLFTHHGSHFSELLSWMAIGARSSEDPEHRVLASAANCPVGLKNPTHGSIAVAVNSVVAAQQGHVAALDGHEVKTPGNAYAHLVLRGANNAPNYGLSYLEQTKTFMHIHGIKNPALLIDVSHDNCLIDGKKVYQAQPKIIFEVLESLKNRPDLKKLVKGFMVESYLKAGQQSLEKETAQSIDRQGLSITDPCLSWAQTEALLLAMAGGF